MDYCFVCLSWLAARGTRRAADRRVWPFYLETTHWCPTMGCVTGLPPGFGWTARETNTREAKPGFLQLYHSLRLNPPTDASCTSITTNHFTWAVYYSMTSLSAGTYHNFLDFAAGVPSRKSVAWISLIPRESRTRTNAAARRLSRTIRDNRHVSSVKSVALGKL